jgi:putative flippase GtrA
MTPRAPGVLFAQLLRFAAVGVVNTTVHVAVYGAVSSVLPYLLAHGFATVAAMSCSYLLHCHFTFRVRPNARRLVLFPLSNAANIGFSTVSVAVLVEWCAFEGVFASVLGGACAIPVTFAVSKAVLVGKGLAATRAMVPLVVGRTG